MYVQNVFLCIYNMLFFFFGNNNKQICNIDFYCNAYKNISIKDTLCMYKVFVYKEAWFFSFQNKGGF